MMTTNSYLIFKIKLKKLLPEILRMLTHCWNTAKIPNKMLQLIMCLIFLKSGDKNSVKIKRQGQIGFNVGLLHAHMTSKVPNT